MRILQDMADRWLVPCLFAFMYGLFVAQREGMEVVKMCEKCNVQVDDMLRQIGQCLRRLQHARLFASIWQAAHSTRGCTVPAWVFVFGGPGYAQFADLKAGFKINWAKLAV